MSSANLWCLQVFYVAFQMHTAGFNSDLALKDLYKYAAEYKYEVNI